MGRARLPNVAVPRAAMLLSKRALQPLATAGWLDAERPAPLAQEVSGAGGVAEAAHDRKLTLLVLSRENVVQMLQAVACRVRAIEEAIAEEEAKHEERKVAEGGMPPRRGVRNSVRMHQDATIAREKKEMVRAVVE